MNETLSAIEIKIKKLIAHEASARQIGSINEADAFAGKISSLCEEYGIELARLAEAKTGSSSTRSSIHSEEVFIHEMGFDFPLPMPLFVGYLFNVVALGNNCKTIRYPGTTKLVLFGHDHDRAVVKALFVELLKSGLQQSKGYLRNPFMDAYIRRIWNRLEEARIERDCVYDSSSTALVRVYRSEVAVAFKEKYPKLVKPARRRVQYDSESIAAGRAAGDRASLRANQMGAGKGANQLGS